jgi:hypothetical protein
LFETLIGKMIDSPAETVTLGSCPSVGEPTVTDRVLPASAVAVEPLSVRMARLAASVSQRLVRERRCTDSPPGPRKMDRRPRDGRRSMRERVIGFAGRGPGTFVPVS